MIIFEISAAEMKRLILGKKFGSYRYFTCGSRCGVIFEGMGFLVHGDGHGAN